MRTVCLRLSADGVATAIWTPAPESSTLTTRLPGRLLFIKSMLTSRALINASRHHTARVPPSYIVTQWQSVYRRRCSIKYWRFASVGHGRPLRWRAEAGFFPEKVGEVFFFPVANCKDRRCAVCRNSVSRFSEKSLKLLPLDVTYFKAKMHQIRRRLGLWLRPRWGAYSAPQAPWI